MFDKIATGPSKPGEKFDIMYIIVKKRWNDKKMQSGLRRILGLK